jgi:glycerophosphoryl diester phosphodiesterase
MTVAVIRCLLIAAAAIACAPASEEAMPDAAQDNRDDREGKTPLVIAHRGASGYLPEHTLEAYALAYGLGADYVEPDLVMTRDRVLICLHDIHLEATTNVEQLFGSRRREDGRWYAADFDLVEIRTLAVHERLQGRFPQDRGRFEVPTFAEMLALIQGLNATTGREVGIYPELKAGAWHREQGLALEEPFLELVTAHGFLGPAASIFVQSFEPDSLRRLRELGSNLPQILLFGTGPESEPFTTAAGLDAAMAFANGLGPDKRVLLERPQVVDLAHERNLLVHPYTFRVDDVGAGYADFEDELRHYAELGIDGLFTDFPDRALAALR